MNKPHWHLYVLAFLALALFALPTLAYEVLLDIDIDQDLTTINEITDETSAVVALILSPTTPGEMVGRVYFGLGGSCNDCYQTGDLYGTQHDLIWPEPGLFQPWSQNPAFNSGSDYTTHLGCWGETSFHLLLWVEPVGGGTISLEQPVLLAAFNVWVTSPVPAGCERPPSNLAVMFSQNEWWNYIQLGGHAVDVETSSWSQIKATYR